MNGSYARVWQGYRRPDLSRNEFESRLVAFMSETERLYREDFRILRSYLVVVTPDSHPSGPVRFRERIPDEFALVSLVSEAEYLRVRATSSGRAYAERHWDVFDPSRSRSVPYGVGGKPLPEASRPVYAWDVLGQAGGRPVDWEKGLTWVGMGTRRPEISPTEFLSRMASHLERTSELSALGMRGLMALVAADYAIQYMNFDSSEVSAAAWASPRGTRILGERTSLQESVLWQKPEAFDHRTVSGGGVYVVGRP